MVPIISPVILAAEEEKLLEVDSELWSDGACVNCGGPCAITSLTILGAQ
jgi:hypothetical protein